LSIPTSHDGSVQQSLARSYVGETSWHAAREW
jgi:hypothetical protein